MENKEEQIKVTKIMNIIDKHITPNPGGGVVTNWTGIREDLVKYFKKE